jgi:hypothetical protein
MADWRVEASPDKVDLGSSFDDEDGTLQDVVEFLQGNHLF